MGDRLEQAVSIRATYSQKAVGALAWSQSNRMTAQQMRRLLVIERTDQIEPYVRAALRAKLLHRDGTNWVLGEKPPPAAPLVEGIDYPPRCVPVRFASPPPVPTAERLVEIEVAIFQKG